MKGSLAFTVKGEPSILSAISGFIWLLSMLQTKFRFMPVVRLYSALRSEMGKALNSTLLMVGMMVSVDSRVTMPLSLTV